MSVLKQEKSSFFIILDFNGQFKAHGLAELSMEKDFNLGAWYLEYSNGKPMRFKHNC